MSIPKEAKTSELTKEQLDKVELECLRRKIDRMHNEVESWMASYKKLEGKYESLHADFIKQSEFWQKTIDEKKKLMVDFNNVSEVVKFLQSDKDRLEIELATAKQDLAIVEEQLTILRSKYIKSF